MSEFEDNIVIVRGNLQMLNSTQHGKMTVAVFLVN